MIIEYKTSDDYIYAYIIWNVIDRDNRLTDNGEIISISGCWIHPNFRNLGFMESLINDVFNHVTTQHSLYVIYDREKYKRGTNLIPISRYLRYIGGYNGKREANI